MTLDFAAVAPPNVPPPAPTNLPVTAPTAWSTEQLALFAAATLHQGRGTGIEEVLQSAEEFASWLRGDSTRSTTVRRRRLAAQSRPDTRLLPAQRGWIERRT